MVAVPALRPLGAETVAGFAYRRGVGQPAYERAVEAAKAAAEDWQAVIDACREALAADPAHLDAWWLLARAYARKGDHGAMLEPLSAAVAGDWSKWGERSLTLPLFGEFLESRWGEAWKELVAEYRAAFAESARRALVVLGRESRDVYAWDRETRRWLRLSRTGGTVIATIPGPEGSGLVAYVAYRDLVKPGDRKAAATRPRVAVIELASGRVSREVGFLGVETLRLGWKAGKDTDEPTLLATVEGDDPGTFTVDWKRGHAKKAAKASAAKNAVVVSRGQVQRLRLPIEKVTADWDDDGLASAIRLDATRKTVTPPSGLVVDGHELVWSPDRARLALVATREGDCDAPATLFVVDAATGKLHSLGPASAPCPQWLDATHLAFTDGDRIRIVDVTSTQTTQELADAATALVSRSCASASEEALFAPALVDDEDVVDEEAPGSRLPAPGSDPELEPDAGP
jgi:hypothetical protein